MKLFEFAQPRRDGVRRSDPAESHERQVADCHGMDLLPWLVFGKFKKYRNKRASRGFTEPGTYASSRSHFLFLMPTDLTLATADFGFLTIGCGRC